MKTPKAKKAKAPAKAAARGADRMARSLKVVAKENPRRPGTAAHKYHEAMGKSKTVGDYLKRFRDDKARRDASIWLSTSVREGHVKVAA